MAETEDKKIDQKGYICDFCGEGTPTTTQITLMTGYNRMGGNPPAKKACDPCSELKMYSSIHANLSALEKKVKGGDTLNENDMYHLGEHVKHLQGVLARMAAESEDDVDFSFKRYTSLRLKATGTDRGKFEELYSHLLAFQKKIE